jgi:hypothetical protein
MSGSAGTSSAPKFTHEVTEWLNGLSWKDFARVSAHIEDARLQRGRPDGWAIHDHGDGLRAITVSASTFWGRRRPATLTFYANSGPPPSLIFLTVVVGSSAEQLSKKEAARASQAMRYVKEEGDDPSNR